MKSKSKKAIILPETLKLIIGVLCIVLLLYLAVKMYDIFTKKSDIEQAKAHLVNIQGKLAELKTQDNGGSFEYMLYNPQGWTLVGWPYEGKQIYNVPYCKEHGWKNCLCLCNLELTTLEKFNYFNYGPEKISEQCNTDKICFNTDVSAMTVNQKSYFFKLFSQDKSPIAIGKLDEDFKGNLLFTYTKSTDSLEIKTIEMK